MCIDHVTTSLFEPAFRLPEGPIQSAHSSESKIFRAIRHFFLACTAVSGIAFAVTGAAGALTTCLILGTVTFCLYFPSDSSSSYRYTRTRRVASSYFDPPPAMYVRRTEYVPQPVVVERRRAPRQGDFNFDAVFPQAGHVVDHFERHPVGGQRRQQEEQQPVVVDPFARHAVGGRVVQDDQIQPGEFDPFERHTVGNG